MSRLRFSIAQLMAVVLLIGFGFAALRNANDVWAGVTFGLAIVTVSMGLAGACSRQAGARMPWAGFGIAGGLRLVVWLSTSSIVGHLNGVPYPLLHRLQPYINTEASSSGSAFIAYTQIYHSLDVVLLGLLAAVLSYVLAVKDDRHSP
jgi:hypothetical protein